MKDREIVSKLIVLVVTDRISVREALLRFPETSGDKNILAAKYALIHFEADEDLRARDFAFKEEQNDYLYMIAELLSNGKDLPKNIIKSYENYYPEIELPKSKTIKNLLKTLYKFLNVK
ncbi:MAG: hypothetical protein LUB59_02980 [Candidatus Gastranaerophilales bacterium]|nr:hypothetical protein [Candidatus Gastranaerophilales bacterium]